MDSKDQNSDLDDAYWKLMEQLRERDLQARYGDRWREVKQQEDEQRAAYERRQEQVSLKAEAEAPLRRVRVLSAYLARPLAEDESALMIVALDFQANGLSDEMLGVAARLSRTIEERANQFKEMSARERYKFIQALHDMLNMMEDFYLFGGSGAVERLGIRAMHPWGAVLYPIYSVFAELGNIHTPLLARKMHEMYAGNPHEAAADARWSKLDSAKKLAFQRRTEMPGVSRAEAIRRMLPEILEAARSSGAPLTGQDPEATITSWFRKAGIS